eukprot:9512-Heterococcus_DN1.PRE.1
MSLNTYCIARYDHIHSYYLMGCVELLDILSKCYIPCKSSKVYPLQTITCSSKRYQRVVVAAIKCVQIAESQFHLWERVVLQRVSKVLCITAHAPAATAALLAAA